MITEITIDVKMDHFYSEVMSNNQPLQLDIYVSRLKIAFEFQGIHHYNTSLFAGKVRSDGTPKEKNKKEACARVGITLVEVCFFLEILF